MNPEIGKALAKGEYICPYCAREDDAVVKLVALTSRGLVYTCHTCLLSFSANTLDKLIDEAVETL
jgi:transposase-like protein